MSSLQMYGCLYAGDCQSQRSLSDILDNNRNATTVWGDHAALWDFTLDVDHYTLPFFFLSQIKEFSEQDYQDADTTAIFNFMINKKALHRYLTIRLVEYRNLKNYNYTYSGSCENINDDRIFSELDLCDATRKIFDKQTMMEILGCVTIPRKIMDVPGSVEISVPGSESQCERLSVPSFKHPAKQYWKLGLSSVFNSSLLSLITESDNGDYDKVTVFTEKTLFAILGLTIPVWPGGYRQANMFETMGFDVFPDLINHSYQFEETLFMRCWRAFDDNLHILQDLEAAKLIRKAIIPRLLRNREHLFSTQLIDWYRAGTENWPTEIKDQVHLRYKKI